MGKKSESRVQLISKNIINMIMKECFRKEEQSDNESTHDELGCEECDGQIGNRLFDLYSIT
jgi:hypothetical protein